MSGSAESTNDMKSSVSDVTVGKPPAPVPLTALFTAFIAAVYAFGVYLFPALMTQMMPYYSMTYSDAGSVMAASQLGFLIAALLSSQLTSSLGALQLVLLSVLVTSVSLLLVPLMPSVPALQVLLFITGACSATVWVPMVVVARTAINPQHQGKALGLMSSGTAYGIFVNGLSIPVLVPTYGWTSVWLMTATLTLILLIMGLVFFGRKVLSRGIVADLPAGRHAELRTVLGERKALAVLAAMFLSGLACMPTQNYLAAYVGTELVLGVAASANIWKIIGFVGMFGGFAMGVMADRLTVQRALTLTYLILAAAVALFAHHGGLLELYIGAALFSLAFNAIFGLIPAYVSLEFRPALTAPIFGAANVMLGLGAMIGNFLGGVIKDWSGSFIPNFIGALFIALFLALLFQLVQKPLVRR